MYSIDLPKNCKNCGAPLDNSKCNYCGTEYQPNLNLKDVKSVTVEIESTECFGGLGDKNMISFITARNATFELPEGDLKMYY